MEVLSPLKRKRLSPARIDDTQDVEESTEVKLALLASLHPSLTQDVLLDALLASNGSVDLASEALDPPRIESPRKKVSKHIGYQSSLSHLVKVANGRSETSTARTLTKKGKTLYLYDPVDVERHTPCSIIHNFLPSAEADALLEELVTEAPSFRKETFRLFDKTVESPHTMAFYVDSLETAHEQQTEYVYNGSYIPDVRRTLPLMRKAQIRVQEAVNKEVQRRREGCYPNGKKLKYQSPGTWIPNAQFCNCYDGGAESVGYHSDQLTYLGPRAVIGSLSLGVAREFRVRRSVPPASGPGADEKHQQQQADTQGQISIHLPHNSLLVMHAEMQEEWKHAIAPAQAIDPHPIAGNKRLNVTYRWYKESLHPRYTPQCKCGVPTVLRCVQKKAENRGKYMWMCHTSYTPGQKGCNYFSWAEFDEDGEPPWAPGFKGKA